MILFVFLWSASKSASGTLADWYVPLTALSPDGRRYFLEYNLSQSIFTPAALQTGSLTQTMQTTWRVAAFGMTEQKTIKGMTFAALPGVRAEVDGIAALLSGTPFMNQAFTKEVLTGGLGSTYPVVHIASHFYLRKVEYPGACPDSGLFGSAAFRPLTLRYSGACPVGSSFSADRR